MYFCLWVAEIGSIVACLLSGSCCGFEDLRVVDYAAV